MAEKTKLFTDRQTVDILTNRVSLVCGKINIVNKQQIGS